MDYQFLPVPLHIPRKLSFSPRQSTIHSHLGGAQHHDDADNRRWKAHIPI